MALNSKAARKLRVPFFESSFPSIRALLAISWVTMTNDPRDGAHHRWNMLRWIADIGRSVAMASSLQHL